MAKIARTRTIREIAPAAEPLPGPKTIELPSVSLVDGVKIKDGVATIENGDGSVTIDFNGDSLAPRSNRKENFYTNLAENDGIELSTIASELLDGIQRDEDSRKDWMDIRAQGISLLGLTIESPRGNSGNSSAPVEGQSTIRHPILLESTVRFQATARGELLPAAGPVKVRNDTPPLPQPPKQPLPAPPQQIPGEPPIPPAPEPEDAAIDEDAAALEIDLNHWLTAVATEWVPDTDRMLFLIGFGGDGFKKIYHCPLRRRPVSESVDAEDLIISNAATDIKNCGRVTHRIKMRKSILRRMQVVGAYRSVDIGMPAPMKQNEVDKAKADVAGQNPAMKRPQDEDYTIYEVYCELEIDDKFAPAKLKDKKVPLPYRVTIEKDSRQVLSIVRNWEKDDDQAMAKQFFVQFPFIRGLGFYGLGMVHLLGNTANTLTASWRLMIDGGMYSNFPGFIIAKNASRQNTNNFRVPPGGSIQLDVPAQGRLQDLIMPIPYKEIGPSFASFVQHVEERADRLGMIGDISVGEGKQDAPVGTTLALIEQATKTIDSAHKRLHQAVAEEFALLKKRFQEDPEAFFRHMKKPAKAWTRAQFLRALNNNNLVPVSDPNNPTSLHRAAKAQAIKELQKASPQLYNAKNVDMLIMRTLNINPEGLFNDTPAPPPPDPRFEAIKAKAEASRVQAMIQQLQEQIKAATKKAELEDRAQERASRERIEEMKVTLQALKLHQESIIHGQENEANMAGKVMDMHTNAVKAQQDMHLKRQQSEHEMESEGISRVQDIHHDHLTKSAEREQQRAQHLHEMQVNREKHAQQMQHEREMHEIKLENERALAKVKAKALASKPKPAKSNTKK